jgi:hypothetical protein
LYRAGRAAALLLFLTSAALFPCAATAAPPKSAPGSASAPTPGQPLRIPLEPMGFQPLLEDFRLAGVSCLTVDFVDADHLLITFNTRHLMRREADQRPEDDDRTIGAFLVEVSSGKVLAQTEWRVHDRLQYLWNLGSGRFLLRVRDQLTVIAPLQALHTDDPFRGAPLLNAERHIVAVLLSSDSDLLTVETTTRRGGQGEASIVSFSGNDNDAAPVQINFYRLSNTADGLVAAYAGAVRTRMALAVPMTTAGFLDVLDGGGRGRWLFNFDEHAGKVDELAEWDTSCFPRSTFVGHGEFVAFGCRGSEEKPELAGFNMKGEEMWEQGIYDSYVSPTFAFAPSAGRFALGRTLLGAPVDADAPLVASLVTGQEVRIYQSYSGKVLFKTDCSPVVLAGQNFALSPDGLRLAVVQQETVRHAATKDDDAYTETSTAVEVYALPELTEQDRAAVKDAQVKAPADTGARIDEALQRVSTTPSAGSGSGVAADKRQSAPAAQPDSATKAEPGNPVVADPGAARGASAESASGPPTAEGDALPDAPRSQPPTLYSPGESPNEKPGQKPDQ